VRVDVDEPGRERESAEVDLPRSRRGEPASEADDPVAGEGNVRLHGRGAGTVEHQRAAEHELRARRVHGPHRLSGEERHAGDGAGTNEISSRHHVESRERRGPAASPGPGGNR
jgi:anti-sigma factor RsiW